MGIFRTARHAFIGLLVLLSSLSIMPSAGAQVSNDPTLTVASAVAPPSSLIVVEGGGFTPGGLVYLAIYDRWGAEVHEHLWTVATSTHARAHGSQDPAQGYVPAGSIAEVIDLFPATVYGVNGSQDPAQGYASGLDTAVAPEAIFGPNGSADPALGYVPAGDQTTSGVACGRDLMVRAYDLRTTAWSNLLDVSIAC